MKLQLMVFVMFFSLQGVCQTNISMSDLIKSGDYKKNNSSKTLSDNDIVKHVERDFPKESVSESFSAPVIKSIFIIDYNDDGMNDAFVWAVSHEEGAKFSMHTFGLYKNEKNSLRLVCIAGSSFNNIEKVTKSGKDVLVNALVYADGDANCCPSVKKTITLFFLNDKIQGLE